MLQLSDHWVWDSWYFDDDLYFHAFFLRASRALLEPDRRHLRASVGHARSLDLIHWELLPDALVAGDLPAWDHVATWTGSVIFDPATNLYNLFYTGVSRSDGLVRQQIGRATSSDLILWNKDPDNPLLSADPQEFETLDLDANHPDEPWRDPWIFFDAKTDTWNMLITASLNQANEHFRGTLAHSTSSDLKNWSTPRPLTGLTGLAQMEVTQVEQIDGRWVLIFCVARIHIRNKDPKYQTGTYSAPADSPTGPFHIDKAEFIEAPGIYAGRIVRDRKNVWNLLGFVNDDGLGNFEGYICDPIPLRLTERGTLQPF